MRKLTRYLAAFLTAFLLLSAAAVAADVIPDAVPMEEETAGEEDILPAPDTDADPDAPPMPDPAEPVPDPETPVPEPTEEPVPAEESYPVTVDFVTGTEALPPPPLSVLYGGVVTLPELSTTRADGWRFVGWSTDWSASVPEYRGGETIPVYGNLFLCAVYAPESYTVLWRIGESETPETVVPGQTVWSVPELPAGYVWQDENGLPADPSMIPVWADRVFTAVQTKAPPPALKGGEHTAYMDGYSDGLFYPDRAVTRGQIAKILYSLLAEPSEETIAFADVPEDAWYALPVGSLGAMGIVFPEEDGRFRAGDPITRAEFAAMLTAFVPLGEDAPTFPDVPEEHWAWQPIRDTAAAGLFGGDAEGLFHPDNTLTRAQAATVLNRLLRRSPDAGAIQTSENVRIFPDVPSSYWAHDQIMEATVSHAAWWNEEGIEHWDAVSSNPVALSDGYHSIDGWLYRVRDGQFLRNTTADGFTFNADGRYTTGNADLDVLLTDVIRARASGSMTRDQKIRALYNYVRDNFTYLARAHVRNGSVGWEPAYALDFLRRGRGNCYSFGATFYLLVRELGLDANTVLGSVGPVSRSPHCWVEIRLDGGSWCFDPELDMAYRAKGNYSYNFYHFTYKTSPFVYFK